MSVSHAAPEPHCFTKSDLTRRLNACLNRSLGAVDVNHVFDCTKTKTKITGIAGMVIEQSVLGYPADSHQAPDLLVDGVQIELKTTGIRLKRKSNPPVFEAKEPMSITAVSPDNIVTEEFDSSHFWKKLEHLLLVYYHYDATKTVTAAEYSRFLIKGYDFHTFNEIEAEILKQDWLRVRDFIKQLQTDYTDYKAQYSRLSSELRSDLLFIDTAPKWPHPPRFRLKRSVVSSMVRKSFGERLEQLPDTYTSYAAIDAKLHQLSAQYVGKTIDELRTAFHLHDSKAVAEEFVVNMFGGKSRKMSGIELFDEIGFIGKTITLTAKGARTEDMKLFPINFDAMREECFEDSDFYEYFANHQFLCIVFEEQSELSSLGSNRFLGFKRLKFNDDFICREVRPIWESIRELIISKQLRDEIVRDRQGNPVINKKTGTIRSAPNFPKAAHSLLFLRGTGRDSTDKTLEVNGVRMLRQNLWIKGSYMARQLESLTYV